MQAKPNLKLIANQICPFDKEKIEFTIDLNYLKKQPSFPISALFQHKEHYLLIYIDANAMVRGIEMVNLNLIPMQQMKDFLVLPNNKEIRYGKIEKVNPKEFFGNKKALFLK